MLTTRHTWTGALVVTRFEWRKPRQASDVLTAVICSACLLEQSSLPLGDPTRNKNSPRPPCWFLTQPSMPLCAWKRTMPITASHAHLCGVFVPLLFSIVPRVLARRAVYLESTAPVVLSLVIYQMSSHKSIPLFLVPATEERLHTAARATQTWADILSQSGDRFI